MLGDRILLSTEGEDGERRSGAGIVIPATASMGRRLAWATVVSVGPNVRHVMRGDRVLFDPEDRAEVEVDSRTFVLLRERDLHAVSEAPRSDERTGLYL
jgi:chaperonin GroES